MQATKALRAAAIALVVSAVLAACGSSGGAPKSTSPPVPSGSGTPADAATTAAVARAYQTFFGSRSTLAESQAALQHGDEFTAELRSEGQTSYAAKSGATVQDVRLQSPDLAVLTFTVTSGGQALLKQVPGYAVRDRGTWQVAATTFCALLKLQHNAPDACDDASVTALPH